jgi:hypothetical protein
LNEILWILTLIRGVCANDGQTDVQPDGQGEPVHEGELVRDMISYEAEGDDCAYNLEDN